MSNIIFQEKQQLTFAKKLKIDDVVWENDIDIPLRTQKVILGRIEKIDKDPKRLLNWDEVSEQL